MLDTQVVDRKKRAIGKVDGIGLELRDGAPPRVASSRSTPSLRGGASAGAAAAGRRASRRGGGTRASVPVPVAARTGPGDRHGNRGRRGAHAGFRFRALAARSRREKVAGRTPMSRLVALERYVGKPVSRCRRAAASDVCTKSGCARRAASSWCWTTWWKGGTARALLAHRARSGNRFPIRPRSCRGLRGALGLHGVSR